MDRIFIFALLTAGYLATSADNSSAQHTAYGLTRSDPNLRCSTALSLHGNEQHKRNDAVDGTKRSKHPLDISKIRAKTQRGNHSPHIQLEILEIEPRRCCCDVQHVQVVQRQQALVKVRLREPHARTKAPQDLNMPLLDLAQGRRDAA